MIQSPASSKDKQSGMALPLVLFVSGFAVLAYIAGSISPAALKIERDKKTFEAIAEAKSALIGRALMDDNRPGSLPCPDSRDDLHGEGSADLFSGSNCPSYIGYFPWKTLGLRPIEDGYGQKLWYALSKNYRDHSAVVPLNGSSYGQLIADGKTDLVAIIFSPGPPLLNQSGRPSRQISDYLEAENADGDNEFSQKQSSLHNDKLLLLTRNELMRQINKRVLSEAASILKTYYASPSHAYFPYASALQTGECDAQTLFTGFLPIQDALGHDCLHSDLPAFSGWIVENDWIDQIRYEVSPACSADHIGCTGSDFIKDERGDMRARLTINSSGQSYAIR